ncbi:MAG TPA: HAMP domain-containing sensor histidine kinase [Candidatus Limnocylindria bacterium]|jgi:signal transduction histidine kinase|nr:HAMP domain-containing sensor histidine kinase [Candidatus Limnocylindria bacterium]
MRERLRRLHEVTNDMLGVLDLARLYAMVADAARSLDTADAASLMVVDHDADALVIRGYSGLSDEYARAQRIPLQRARRHYERPGSVVVRDLRTAPLGDPVLIQREGLAKVLALSIAREGELLGALHIYTRDPARDFDDVDRDLAHVLASQVAVAIANARLFTQLREMDREREQFLSIVSHELRTPLTPLKALAQLQLGRLHRSQERGTPMDLEALERNLESIERQVDRMNGLVNDLLSVSRAGRGTLDMERAPFDLAAEVRDVVGRYVAATREEGRHSFVLDSPDTLAYDGDQSRIDQLLMNLVGNAVKYSPRGGQVAVRLVRQNGAAEIAISDQGIGIPSDDLARLGTAFTRGAGKAATFAGMGIGLHVAKLVAEAHGGSLELESAGEDRGTTVRVRLPL